MLTFSSPQGVQHDHAADGEAEDCAEGGDLHQIRVEMETVGENRADGEDQSQNIQPERRADGGSQVLA